jgi:septum formation protein
MILIPDFIYLASQSPRRSQLLDQLGIRHELLLPDADEDPESLEVHLRSEAPKTYVQRVTRLKLQAALQRMARRKLPEAPILCADTTVALGRTIFGKPQDAQDARRMLGALANRPHRVITAIAVGWEHGQAHALQRILGHFFRHDVRPTSRPTWLPVSPWARPVPTRCREWRRRILPT